MEALQIIGIGAILFVIYKYIYVPILTKRQDEKKEIEEIIEVLSHSHRGMRELFQKHINPAYEIDEDGNKVLIKGWVKVFNRVLYFTNDSELNDFRAMANSLYNELKSNDKSRIEIEVLFKQHIDYVEKSDIEKANKYLELRKNLLDYKKVMSEIFSNNNNPLESETIIKGLSERLQLTNDDSIKLFGKLSHYSTGIIFAYGSSKEGKKLYLFDESFIDRKTIRDFG